MLLTVLIILAIASAITTLISFVFYIRARVAERAHPDDDEADLQQQAELDRKERLYLGIHYKSLFFFVVLGVLILIIISRRMA